MSETEAENESVEEVVQEPVPDQEQVVEEAEKPEEMVPLSALKKERQKRKEERDERLKLLETMHASSRNTPVEEDISFDPLTKSDEARLSFQIRQEWSEAEWVKNYPERAEEVNEKITEFIKKNPHRGRAIEAAPNRYEEAWTLLNALSPKQKAALAPVAAKPAPGQPASVPKSTGLKDTVSVMEMSDDEYRKWRKSQSKRRGAL